MPVVPAVPTLAAAVISAAAAFILKLNMQERVTSSDSVPVLDVLDLANARAVRTAATHLGIFRLTGHQAPIEGILNASHQFFGLSDTIKRSARSSTGVSGGFQRGYIPLAGESGLRDFVELKEGFCYGRARRTVAAGASEAASLGGASEHEERTQPSKQQHPPLQSNVSELQLRSCDQLVSPNAWPEDLAETDRGWQQTLEGYIERCHVLSDRLHVALSEAMGRRSDFLAQLAAGGEDISLMRLFHYFAPTAFPHVAPGVPRTGSSPHSDWHLVTIVLQDRTGGLQVRRPRKPFDWIDVPAAEGELIVILGDYLSALSGGSFVSPVHRVLLPAPPQERFSLTYFRYPSCTATVSPSAARRAERRARRQERARRAHLREDSKFNTLVAPAPGGAGLNVLARRPWGDLLVDKWNGVASNKV